MVKKLILLLFLVFLNCNAAPVVSVGAEQLLTPQFASLLRGKSIGLITNHTAVDHTLTTTYDRLRLMQESLHFKLIALFAPEHGFYGAVYAEKELDHSRTPHGLPIHSLHGKTKRPTAEMLKGIDLLIYDIQDIGSRSYTYISTLFYVMEEAAKAKIPVYVLDRPNPINGVVVDGPMMEEKWRSIVGYINVPYCHGMTIGELALYFNREYHINCHLTVIPMRGWHRSMSFKDTGLPWIPTSPHIPDSSTPLHYPTTGILGELSVANIGVGYTLPFKLVGAPWINGEKFAAKLNDQKLPGVYFKSYHYKPFYALYANEECQGVLIVIMDPLVYKPITTQYTLIGVLKAMYPERFASAITKSKDRREMFCKVNGNEKCWAIISQQRNIVWKLREIDEDARNAFLKIRSKYLHPNYPA